MKKAFLVDFENVKSAGLVGLEQLSAADEVVVLYSANSNTISFEMHQKILQSPACVDYYQIRRGGKNSLDFQLSSLLGYLLGTGAYSHLYVVSNDAGFDVLRDFWTSDFVPNECVVYRRGNLAACLAHARLLEEGRQPQADTAQPQSEAAAEQPAAQPVPQPEEQPAEPVAAEEELVQSVEAEPAAPEQPEQPEVRPEESQPERRSERQGRGRRKNQKQPQNQPQAQPQSQPQPKAAMEETSRTALEQALPAAFVALADETTRRQVTELLVSTEGKQDFYRRIIADYGQKKGLEIYKTIKSEYTNLKKLLEKSSS